MSREFGGVAGELALAVVLAMLLIFGGVALMSRVWRGGERG